MIDYFYYYYCLKRPIIQGRNSNIINVNDYRIIFHLFDEKQNICTILVILSAHINQNYTSNDLSFSPNDENLMKTEQHSKRYILIGLR